MTRKSKCLIRKNNSRKHKRSTFNKKSAKFPRKYSRSYCKKTPCKKMGFSQKASCRYYKNCYNKK